jgi:hypothetical protein
MAHRLQTPAGRKLYALRKQTPEPVFGIIKSVMVFDCRAIPDPRHCHSGVLRPKPRNFRNDGW